MSRNSLVGTARAFDPQADVPDLPDWQAIPTPGHTPGHVAFFRSTDRVLITGDAVLTVNLNSVPDLLAGKHRVSGPPYISTWDWPAAKQSVAALAGFRPDVLACGHGRPMTGPGCGEPGVVLRWPLPAASLKPLPQGQDSQGRKDPGARWPTSPARTGFLEGHGRRTGDAAPRR